jgi:uncharacterized iron-regulated membrane protein
MVPVKLIVVLLVGIVVLPGLAIGILTWVKRRKATSGRDQNKPGG